MTDSCRRPLRTAQAAIWKSARTYGSILKRKWRPRNSDRHCLSQRCPEAFGNLILKSNAKTHINVILHLARPSHLTSDRIANVRVKNDTYNFTWSHFLSGTELSSSFRKSRNNRRMARFFGCRFSQQRRAEWKTTPNCFPVRELVLLSHGWSPPLARTIRTS